ncbi:MAG: DUF2383 domain-containing protein [Bacteroidetes bacterium]|nr:DUF2383 domain-containing protein [Bacteroidota bacterium]
MENVNKQIKKLIKLHTDCAEYYRRCAEITTEEDLIELFRSMSAQRRKMANILSSNVPFGSEREMWLFKDVLSYLQQAWKHMKLALIINNRQQILDYSFKNEQAMLREYEQISVSSDFSEGLFRHGIHHQQLLKESLRRISELPTIKFSRQRNMVRYAMQERA